MTHGKHTRRRWWSRKWAGLPVVGWLIALVGGGVAIAALVFALGMAGTYTFTVAEQYGVEYTNLGAENPTPDCTRSITASTYSVDSWANFGPGSTCEAAVTFTNTGNVDVYVADFTSSDPLIIATDDWTGTTVSGCHMKIPAGGTSASFFGFRLTIGDPGNVAGTYNIDLSNVEIVFSDDPLEGDCDSSTA